MYICLMLLIATSGLAQNVYTIKGQIKGLPDGTVMTLKLFSHQDEKSFNKAVLKDGKFVFKGVQKEPRAVSLGAEGVMGGYLFILNNVNISITGEVLKQPSGNRNYYDFMTVKENGQERTLRTLGDKWSYLQRSKFGANAQPFYVLVDNNGMSLRSTSAIITTSSPALSVTGFLS